MKEFFVQASNARIFCKVIGQGDPIIILHGGPGLSLDYLFPQMQKLAETNLVIFYDQRGCGLSKGEINPDTINIPIFLDDLECIRKTFGFKKTHILGHSWGGFLSMNYAISYPESISKLILLNPIPSSSEDFDLFIKE